MKKLAIATKVSIFTIFQEALIKFARTEEIGIIYAHLFSLKTDDEMEYELEYLYSLYKGTDSYFKKDSIDCWFAIWHKTIRQCDYFKGCYQENKIDLITKKERAEFKFLQNKVYTKGYSKTEGKDPNSLFNEEYKRYLNLHDKVRRENKNDSINGKLDSILWNLVHVDTDNKLLKLFTKTFLIYEDKI